MRYNGDICPDDFSKGAVLAVDRQLIRARREHQSRQESEPFDETKSLHIFIMSVFGAYAKEVIRLVKQSEWRSDEANREALEGLYWITVRVLEDSGCWREGWFVDRAGRLDPDLLNTLKRLPAWLMFENGLLRLPRAPGRKSSAPAESGRAASWNDIEIVFMNEHSIRISDGAQNKNLTYVDFNLDDGRTGKPNQAWALLRMMAEQKGVIKSTESGKPLPWEKVEKSVQKIRKTLQNYFSIKADPLPFVPGTGYHARFKISCGPSYDR